MKSVVEAGVGTGDDSYLNLEEHLEDIAPELLSVPLDELDEYLLLNNKHTQEAIERILEEANNIKQRLEAGTEEDEN